jgi:hypothetical protein
MQGTAGLDELLDDEEPHATFHDAQLVSLTIDYRTSELLSTWRICVGDPHAPDSAVRERCRDGLLTLQGLVFWVVEPPTELDLKGGLPWLTADGPLQECTTATGQSLARLLPAGAVGWYLYFSDWNAFAYCAATAAGFKWV